ncbi:unnamed protein product [Moneuplotes crassus]|uniref:Transcription factor CBF/NF-Y/archaeal histone domain-containing protein n=2 Tax=Euplotes crassus TaxID=5936 RepID=A0AAD1UJK8_EUPCR|nr:unnamed protein product [Moneuplotes crassus]
MNEDIGLPKATILNLIKDYLPEDTRISTEANEVILGMTKEFVNHLSSISNDICLDGGKKTISQAHVAEAMKNLKLDSYLAKIMNIEDSKELEGMTEKKKKMMLNTSLNVSRKKKHRLTAEQEEELRRKQASLFRNDQTSSMNTGGGMSAEPKGQTLTPTFPSAGIPSPQPQIIQPNNPQFYDGSITQVLQNPLPSAGIPMPSNSFPLLGLPPQSSHGQGGSLASAPVAATAPVTSAEAEVAPAQPKVAVVAPQESQVAPAEPETAPLQDQPSNPEESQQ